MSPTALLRRRQAVGRRLFAGLCWVALLGLGLLPCLGLTPAGYEGWLTQPPVWYGPPPPRVGRHSQQGHACWHLHWSAAWAYARRSSQSLGWQLWLLLLLGLVPSLVGSWDTCGLVLVLPVVRWGLAVSAVACPGWGQSGLCRGLRWGLYRLYQLTVLLLLALNLGQLPRADPPAFVGGGLVVPLAGGGLVRESQGGQASYTTAANGTCEITLAGPQGDQWFLRYQSVDEFDRRMFLNFLRHIWTPADTPHRPFLRQEWLAEWSGTHQELLSRWEDYRRAGDWPRLMSRRHGPLLTLDQIQQIVTVWAPNFWWTADEVVAHLTAHGQTYTCSQVEEAGRLSGFLQLRRCLQERFHLDPAAVRPTDDWLVQRLFAQLDALLHLVETGGRLTPEARLVIGTLQAQRQAWGWSSGRELAKPLPWLYQAQQVLFGWWEEVEDGAARCTHCGSIQVARKSRQPRYKQYYDAAGHLQEVAVYRYYCLNPACPHRTFTNLPPGLVPYSRWPLDHHLLALQAYAWGRGAYRLVGQAAGISTATAYRWVSAWGQDLLPMAALFGVVRSSGVVGGDEKWVLVPKNDKPAGKHQRWMYVYLAVDVYTYDLLHIAIFPYLGKDSARAFLLALRAKGYQPRVIVTDLNQDYSQPVAQVFPKAPHHECIFHALQWTQRQVKEVYGAAYEEAHPEAVQLKEHIYRIFQCRDKRTAQRRYAQVLALRQQYVAEQPEAAAIFDTLERHWPKLVNAMGSTVIPKTNNAVELVIRRFDQHYQNFCGFERIETAQQFLAVFEWVYRFTPFATDNKKDQERPPDQRIGGKCPLELAGYEVHHLPIAPICRGRLLNWPGAALGEVVPNA